MATFEVDWEKWQPREKATLLFVVRDEQVLLIRKKRGLGAGKINGPGGRIDPGETPLAGAIREVREELHITPVGVVEAGVLRFQFVDGLPLLVHVFRATDCLGEAEETDEATPLWIGLDEIPYDEMWADDRHWLPLMLKNESFEGHFVFDGDRMLEFDIRPKHDFE